MLDGIIDILDVWMPVWNNYLVPMVGLCFIGFVPKFVYFIVRGE